MNITATNWEHRFEQYLSEYLAAPSFQKTEKKSRLLSQLDLLLRTEDGGQLAFGRINELIHAGIFADTPWENPRFLVPGLVAGTLLSGHPNSTMEALSELRMLHIVQEQSNEAASREALWFLHEVIVTNFDLVMEDFSAMVWQGHDRGELQKISLLFDRIMGTISFEALLPKLAEEVKIQLAHRPIETYKVESMIRALAEYYKNKNPQLEIQELIVALFPTQDRPFADLQKEELQQLSQELGNRMEETGLISLLHLDLLKYLVDHYPNLIPLALNLDAHGRADYERHQAFVGLLIRDFLTPAKKQGVYGLARVLERNLLSRKTSWNAINRLIRITIHPEVAKNLQKGNLSKYECKPIQLLVSGTLCVLGQPLGIRQGNNPTCQSARALSMWSRHAPAKLITLLIDAAMTNNVIFRYEGTLLESSQISQGVAQKIDYKLDPVSIVMVPLLDKVYNEMMKRAALKHPFNDAHVSVNPAFYGHWIQTGFQSVYNPLTNSIEQFDDFVKTFYASFHPEYNGGHHLIYPVPVGIFITNTQGSMLGYHAISLLRIEKATGGAWRAYYFNPNSEGKQNWGQGILPTVSGYGERKGESSLPVYQFVARVYAFHYNELRLGEKPEQVPEEIVSEIGQLALASWGQKYNWSE